MLHVRPIAPAEVSERTYDLLRRTTGVTNIVVRPGPPGSPPGPAAVRCGPRRADLPGNGARGSESDPVDRPSCEVPGALFLDRHTGQVRITSFDSQTLSAVHAATTIPVGLLVSTYVPGAMVTATGATAVLVQYASVTASRVADWHRAGLTVLSWTPNSAALWAQQRAFGVDGIITDLAAFYLDR